MMSSLNKDSSGYDKKAENDKNRKKSEHTFCTEPRGLKNSGTTSRLFGRGLMHSLILLSCVSTFTFHCLSTANSSV